MSKLLKGWAVARDDELFCISHSRRDAQDIISNYQQGSKHWWRAVRVNVMPLKPLTKIARRKTNARCR